MQFTTTLRNNRSGQIGTTLGAGGTLAIRTGAPAGVSNADSGTLLSTLTNVAYSSSGGVCTITATADGSAAASGTPGHGRLLTSGATAHMELTAGVGTQAVAGTATVSGNTVTGCPVTSGGSGYSISNPPIILVTGGGGFGCQMSATISGGTVSGLTVVNGGSGYTTPPTVTIMPPFDLTFSATISLGGTVTLTSGSITEGNS